LDLFIRRPHLDGVHLLAETDMARYQLIRRSAGPAFTASNLKRYEPKIVEAMQRVCERLNRLNGEEVETSEWMHITVLGKIGLSSLRWSS
jgi:cytochrome P450